MLAANPQVGGAYANLGVVYMRRKQWTKALEMLRKAEHLLPQEPGIRLNIGLAYFRQSEFLKAIPPFESVVRDQPDALQAPTSAGSLLLFRRALGRRGEHAGAALDAGIHAVELSLRALDRRPSRRHERNWMKKPRRNLIKAGEGSPEFHLFMGKAHLNLEQYDLGSRRFPGGGTGESHT